MPIILREFTCKTLPRKSLKYKWVKDNYYQCLIWVNELQRAENATLKWKSIVEDFKITNMYKMYKFKKAKTLKDN